MKTSLISLFLTAAVVVTAFQDQAVFADEQVVIARNGDARLRVFSEGSGPTIVLLPGQGRGPRDLETLAAALVTSGYRVVRPEPRGFGESVGPPDGVDLRDIAADVAAATESATRRHLRLHSITSSARASSDPGSLRLSAFAVFHRKSNRI